MIKLPAQPTDTDESRRAFAPYNFVPLPEKIATLKWEDLPDQGVYHKDRISGWLDCELTTGSPIYVRAGYPPGKIRKDTESDPEEFFYVPDKGQPVIPGSSLRGMLRAMVEIVSYSKVGPVSDSNMVYRAIGDVTSHGTRYRERLIQDDREKRFTPLIRGGYMEKKKQGQEWVIKPAKETDGTTYAYISLKDPLFSDPLFKKQKKTGSGNARKIFIETGQYKYQNVKGGFLRIRFARVVRASCSPRPGLRPATLALSGHMFSKRTEAVIYEENDDAEPLRLSDDQIEAYKDQLKNSREQKYLLGDDGVLRQGQPVFYVQKPDGKVDFFGHCRMFRVPYPNSLRDYVPEMLRREYEIDLAEAIFGYTKEDRTIKMRERAYAGRVCVSDAKLNPGQDSLWLSQEKTVVPRILANPKPTTFQHYLVQTRPNAIPVGKTKLGTPKFEIRLSDYTAPTPGETVIRGHKIYWHKGEVTLDKIRETKELKKKDTQHTRIQPLKPGIKFQFRINFENLSHVELGALLWVLDIASDEQYRLKIGMGKPLGMGAVRIRSRLNCTDRSKRYRSLFQEDGWAEGVQKNTGIKDKAVADFEKFVLQQVNEENAQSLDKLKRIQSLLAMLKWPGPDTDQTRYMEIELRDPKVRRGKRNEYRGRPVLPVPLSVMGDFEDVQSSSAPSYMPEGCFTGIVKEFGLGNNRSYGYIQYENEHGNEETIFVHKSRLSKGLTALKADDKVLFRKGIGAKGPQAVDVELST